MNLYCLLADVVAVLHFLIVAFVLGGMLLILAGVLWHWTWIRNFWFRAVHVAMIVAVVAESLCGIVCPLTNWEDRLREAGSAPTSEPGSFLGRLVHSLLFVERVPCRPVHLLRHLWSGRAAGLHPGAAALAPTVAKSVAGTCCLLSGRWKCGTIASVLYHVRDVDAIILVSR